LWRARTEYPLGKVEPDIAAAHDDHSPGHLLLMAEEAHDAVYASGLRDEIYIVATLDVVSPGGDHSLSVTDDGKHNKTGVREKLR
jgi:hypothetical protein